nr:MAG TPA: hypothetical protein [Caudoviricetes sp.]
MNHNPPYGVADMSDYRQNFTEAARQARARASLVVSPEKLTVYRRLARTAWERLRQEDRKQGLVWFDPELQVVPEAQRLHGPYTAELTTVAVGVVHDSPYVDSNGWRREHVAHGRRQVSVQLPRGKDGWPALWVSDFDDATGPGETAPHHCERVDWNSPLRLKGERK